MIATAPSGEQRLYWPGMWTWTLVRFVHVTGAAVWLGIQVTLLVLVPAIRRQLPAEQVRDNVRRAGRSQAIVGGTAHLMIAARGFALARHECSAKADPGVVGL
jgi:putative copper export protein